MQVASCLPCTCMVCIVVVVQWTDQKTKKPLGGYPLIQKSCEHCWYPEFYNPMINHVKPMRCSYEVVFPLYSLPFMYLLFLLFSVLCCRSILYVFILKRNRDAKAFYYALLSIPKIAVVHALLAGVLYQSYPYIVMLWSLCANAVHLAAEGKISMKEIAKVVCTSPMHMVMLAVNMTLLAFSLLAISAQNTVVLIRCFVNVNALFVRTTRSPRSQPHETCGSILLKV
ncbi:unnamed protein product [Haemonchus placei]|uniref:GPI mannosyltransferase 2 n=1 Tax=Haemonchus placei TaxID=6290 RepID=A0A0N4X1E7_HAEPC|nr:unnamed protein product [Haemonchus placei]